MHVWMRTRLKPRRAVCRCSALTGPQHRCGQMFALQTAERKSHPSKQQQQRLKFRPPAPALHLPGEELSLRAHQTAPVTCPWSGAARGRLTAQRGDPSTCRRTRPLRARLRGRRALGGAPPSPASPERSGRFPRGRKGCCCCGRSPGRLSQAAGRPTSW